MAGKYTDKKVAEVCGGNTDTELNIVWRHRYYTVPLYAQFSRLDLTYSPLWSRLFNEWDWLYACPGDIGPTMETFFEYTQGMGRDKQGRVLTNDFNAYVNGYTDDSLCYFDERDDLYYVIFQNKSQLPGNWILIITTGAVTSAFYAPHGEDTISTLQAALELQCDTCGHFVENYTTWFDFPWDEVIFQDEEDSIRADYSVMSPNQQLLPGMPKPAHRRPNPKYRILPEDVDEQDPDSQILFIHDVGPICPGCWNGVLK